MRTPDLWFFTASPGSLAAVHGVRVARHPSSLQATANDAQTITSLLGSQTAGRRYPEAMPTIDQTADALYTSATQRPDLAVSLLKVAILTKAPAGTARNVTSRIRPLISRTPSAHPDPYVLAVTRRRPLPPCRTRPAPSLVELATWRWTRIARMSSTALLARSHLAGSLRQRVRRQLQWLRPRRWAMIRPRLRQSRASRGARPGGTIALPPAPIGCKRRC